MQARVAAAPLLLARRFWNHPSPAQIHFPSHTFCVPKMGGAHDSPNSIYRDKKGKLFVPIWRPISTQSGAPVTGTSVSVSSSSMDHARQSTAKMEDESFFSSCEAEAKSERHDHAPVSEVHQQIEATEERMHNCCSNKDAALVHVVHEVKKHSVSVEAVKSRSLDYSHFISLPLAIHPELVDKLEKFQNDILGCTISGHDGNLEDASEVGEDEGKPVIVNFEVENENEHVMAKIDTADADANANASASASSLASSISSELGIEKSIFIKPKTFHLTVLMLKLWNKERVAAATEVLQKISSQVNDALDNRPVFIRLKGLDCMRGSPAKASVLYAPVEEIGGEGRLLRACHVIIKAFVEAGLVLEKDARQTLKLHATLMNASHRKRKKGVMRRHSFDARGIFLRYGTEEWGDYLIREAHLSQRFVFDESGYYHCCASIPFPESMQLD